MNDIYNPRDPMATPPESYVRKHMQRSNSLTESTMTNLEVLQRRCSARHPTSQSIVEGQQLRQLIEAYQHKAYWRFNEATAVEFAKGQTPMVEEVTRRRMGIKEAKLQVTEAYEDLQKIAPKRPSRNPTAFVTPSWDPSADEFQLRYL